MAKSPQAVAEKWAKNLGGSIESIRQGVNAVTESPTHRAARNVAAYLANIQQAVADGTFEAALMAVDVGTWKRLMLEKGVNRIASGATSATPKMQAFMSEFLPFVDEGVRSLESMPRGGLEQNINRAIAMMRHNAGFKRRRGR